MEKNARRRTTPPQQGKATWEKGDPIDSVDTYMLARAHYRRERKAIKRAKAANGKYLRREISNNALLKKLRAWEEK